MDINKTLFTVSAILIMGVATVFAGSITATNLMIQADTIQADTYKSSDGSEGITDRIDIIATDGSKKKLVIKNGLIVKINDAVTRFPTKGLISYYKLDESSGTTAIDSHSSNDGTNQGATVDQPGKLNTAYEFDGSNSYVDTIPQPDIPSVITVSMWIYPIDKSSQIWGSINDAGGGKNGYASNYDAMNKRVRFLYFSNNGLEGDFNTPDNSVPLNEWSLITYTVNSSDNITVYVNGIEEVSGTFSVSPTVHDRALMIGKSINSQSHAFDGTIDEIGVWDRALTAAEVNRLYNNGNGLAY